MASEDQMQSIYRLRWVGYGLLLLALFDVIQLLLPLDYQNPVWVLQTVGAIVERVPVPLLGLLLIFFGEDAERTSIEDILLKVLRWATLLLAIGFLAMVPLGVAYTLRIDNQNNQQIAALQQRQTTQLETVEQRVTKGSAEDIKNLGTELNRMGLPVDPQKPDELKTKILERISTAKTQVPTQAKLTQDNQRLALFKNSVKWNIGALVSSVLLFIIWRSTGWV